MKDEGYVIPPKPSTNVCDYPEEERREMMRILLEKLENNDCEPCIEGIRDQILELLKCDPDEETFNLAMEYFNG